MVETSESSGESSDWELVQHSSDQPSSPPPQGQLLGYEMVIRDNFYGDNSIFPPSEHEDLPLLGEASGSPRNTSPRRQSSLSSACTDIGSPKEQQTKSDTRLSIMMNVMGTRIGSIACLREDSAVAKPPSGPHKRERPENQPALASDSAHERDLVSTTEGSSLANLIRPM
uniref:Uncharacterized protein n=1 Tax=Chenopodium quinoa TaxID=63459 RepID=A0A803L1W1_CHEQI